MAADARNRLTGGGRPGAPAAQPLPAGAGHPDAPPLQSAHACWYPSADPGGERVAFVCDRGGSPQLWAGPADGDRARPLDTAPDHVTEVAWSPDGRWIAYTVAPGGSGHTRVLCVRPDGSDRRVLAGAEPGTSASLGCWVGDGSALAVTVAEPVDGAGEPVRPAQDPSVRPDRDGPATLLGAGGRPGPVRDRLGAYLIDPDGVRPPVLLADESGAATLRVCDVSRDGRLALLRRGPRGGREAVVVRVADRTAACTLPVADGDPWIGRFSADARTVWLRSDHGAEFAALLALGVDEDGRRTGLREIARRAAQDLELFALVEDGRRAALVWNAGGTSEMETLALPAPEAREVRVPPRAVALDHEVVTRVAAAGPYGLVAALAGSQRRPGVWHLADASTALRTPWTARDADTVPPGPAPVRPVPMRPKARDGLRLGGWYHRAPGRASGEPAPCVVHLHGGPEEQERPVFDPLYHELTGRGLDVFAPDVRGSSGWGRAFRDADLGEGRFAAIDDVADCVAHAVEAGLADVRRLAVMGHSYGGYLTLASLVRHPGLFRTGVTVCGMSDLTTFFATTEPWLAESAAHKYGHPERDRALLRALSPMSRVDALRVPLLAVHGAHDTNVPPSESEQIVRAARERGHEAELLLLHGEGHDFRRADSRRLFRRTAADWIEKRLG
ncbi:alpha/beta fold hydrolase [Streptomyces omiyaensis]|uniref:S9 family peptidase n=1 Tax=Streptomyces omiyaensis TaxID=68247 RepID=A0ABW7BL53_9ACTN|nr:alpha/beta fold hydrolase [Streptomyces omiyaensis]GGY46627.1 peptidase S9 [Streptomyces omiyaensis]